MVKVAGEQALRILVAINEDTNKIACNRVEQGGEPGESGNEATGNEEVEDREDARGGEADEEGDTEPFGF